MTALNNFRSIAGKFKSDVKFRAEIMLYVGFAINVIYAAIHAVFGITGRSIWSGTMAFYYIILGFVRLYLLRGKRAESIVKQWKKYRISAAVMLALVFALFGIHCITLYMGHTVQYPGYIIYGVAAYTFYALAMAIRNMTKPAPNPLIKASNALYLDAAVISLYLLQSALISAFGEGDQENFRTLMGNIVGAGAFVLICAVSVLMIVKSTREICKK